MQAAGEADVDTAVKAAHTALRHPSWKRLPATDRGILMTKLADLIHENRELFATIEAWDNGTHNSYPTTSFLTPELTPHEARPTMKHLVPTLLRRLA